MIETLNNDTIENVVQGTKLRVGIVGHGFVGKEVYYGFTTT